MRIGVGLPTATPPHPGVDRGEAIVSWARRADDGPFASLGVTDRLVWDCLDPFVALAGAAAVTRRVRLVTMIVIGPIRPPAALAAAAASLDALSGGRLVLGVAVGARPDDYAAAGASWADRGRRLSDTLAVLRETWDRETPDGSLPAGPPPATPAGAPLTTPAGAPLTTPAGPPLTTPAGPPLTTPAGPPPASPGGPELLVGGGSGAAFLRAARLADGYVHGGGPPRAFAGAAARARAAWLDAGRPGPPRLWGQSYFSLADPDAGRDFLRRYYAFTGHFAERIASGLLDSRTALAAHLAGYADAGCDELVLLPATSDPSELDRLAEAL